jgi:hypothetical protein
MSLNPDEIAALPRVRAPLNYLAHMDEVPFTYAYEPPAGQPMTNAIYEPVTAPILDLRPIADRLSLDVEGLALVPYKSDLDNLYDEDALKRVFYPEVQALVRKVTGAVRVEIFDHTFRKRIDALKNNSATPQRQPVLRVHNDYTEKSGPQRVRDIFPSEADDLLKRRFAFINVWRPINGPVLDTPFAICDATSAAPEDFIASEIRYRDRTGEIYVNTYNPNHRWFYAPKMRDDEALLVKCYDSERTVARFTAHSAFEDPTTPPDAPPRESIEVRVVAFF